MHEIINEDTRYVITRVVLHSFGGLAIFACFWGFPWLEQATLVAH